MDDQEYIRLLRQGDKSAFERLYKEYAPRIFNFSHSYIHNPTESEELVQDVFLKIWEKRESLQITGNLKAYIFKVAVNTFYDFIRRKNVEYAFKDYMESGQETSTDCTWHAVIQNELANRLDELVELFPEQRKKIFLMSRKDYLSNDEIAEKLNLSKRTVENQIYRAVSFLKKRLGNDPVPVLLLFYLIYS